DHWHFEGFAAYELRKATIESNPYDPANTVVANHGKVTFCMIDTDVIREYTGPEQPKKAVYNACGTNVQGISVGWSDEYGWSLFDQWIVIDGLPDGAYFLVGTSNPVGKLIESDTTDNRAAVLIDIRNGKAHAR